MQPFDDYPPVFRSLAEMDAWDEGIEQYHVCAVCGETLADDAVMGEVMDITGQERLDWLCQTCWEKQQR